MSNPLINRISAEKGISKDYLKSLWEEAENEIISNAKTATEKNKGSKQFWKNVKTKFLEKIDDLDIKEARLIMDSREKYKEASRNFLNAIQGDDYVAAKEVFPDVIENKLNTVINNLKDGYLKNMAAKNSKET